MPTSTHDEPPKAFGPGTGLPQVFAFFETDGHRDPAGAWRAFTGTWNWAAPLTTAVPRTHPAGPPVARPADGGFTLSGPWHLPLHRGTGEWLALPLHRGGLAPGRRTAGPDLFVVPAKVLPGEAGEALRATGGDDASGPAFRLAGTHVPTGFATHTAGAPLGTGDHAFLRTAVAALALGAARRVTDVLAGPGPDGRRAVAPVAAAAELAAVLHDERLSLAAAMHSTPSVRQPPYEPPDAEERLAGRVRQAVNTVRHVVMAAYEHTLSAGGSSGDHPLMSIIEAISPILQQARYATELLPPDDRTSLRKADHGDDRRIPG
ncbi:hypothetical protein [Streptomyces sp. NPDC056796]|uniref:hypothetical protein n=1 Tax=Streptomyces sp. NPDC056796 TaxID=3345947 RepID=UPI0036A60872